MGPSEIIVAIVVVIAGMAAAGVAGYFIAHKQKEVTMEERFHNMINVALEKIKSAGASVGSGARSAAAASGNKISEISHSAKDAAASALHASEDEAAYLLRAAADKLSKE